MNKLNSSPSPILLPSLGWILLTFLAYGLLLVHPDIHTACPENDTWNFPIRWSVLSSWREGKIPLWNPLSAFGIPWLATWQTETFYPGTQCFKWFGLQAWNYSGVVHLLIFALGVYRFLRLNAVQPLWAFLAAATGFLNGCAFNHLGSNSSMDTMAWMPWLMVAAKEISGRKPWSGLKLGFFLGLQILAGYPQIIFYALAGCVSYTLFVGGFRAARAALIPITGALLLTACQWIPSVEYFLVNCVRLPAVQGNPHFFLPLENLKTFWDFNALSKNGAPDYVASPTFFYFNFYSGPVPLALLVLGIIWMKFLRPISRFFLAGFLLWVLWAVGFLLWPFEALGLPIPGLLEPAKSWVVLNLFEILAMGFILEDFNFRRVVGKWATFIVVLVNLLIPIWIHPYERNFTPPSPFLDTQAKELKDHLGSSRVLVLPDAREHAALYTPLPSKTLDPLFKRFVPDSNLLASIPVPNFYGSTWPSWGALDAAGYFQFAFPYDKGNLLDLLGVGLLYLPTGDLPERYEKIASDGNWGLWKNPGSLGDGFLFTGTPVQGTRKQAFEAFASNAAQPLQTLYLSEDPVSLAPRRPCDASPSTGSLKELKPQDKGFYVLGQNAMPGWRAWVDGKPVDLFLADGIFLAAPIPPNSHWVKFAYEPASFRFGLFLSLTAVMGLMGWFGWRRTA